jgi:hypothetical protein
MYDTESSDAQKPLDRSNEKFVRLQSVFCLRAIFFIRKRIFEE